MKMNNRIFGIYISFLWVEAQRNIVYNNASPLYLWNLNRSSINEHRRDQK